MGANIIGRPHDLAPAMAFAKSHEERVAADLRTEAGRIAAAARETVEHYRNVLLKNQDAEVILRRE